jgi:MoaA/NifB/PqqE/SkfB family radical SAM enzyme
MSPKQAIEIAAALFKIHVLGRRVPLFVAWNVTFRCNLRCMYCGTNEVHVPEWNLDQIRGGLDELWDLGARWITFGGGEPLVRHDIGEILASAKGKGFQVFLSTNGALVPRKQAAMRWVDHVNLSLDGPRDVHDLVRGKGTFDRALEAIDVFQSLGVRVSLLCVLSKYNLNQAETVVEIASRRGLLAMFQPADRYLNTSWQPNPICPPVEEYRAAVGRLIELKRRGAPIRNSAAGLRHLSRWPEPARPWCPAGVAIAVVEPDGSLVSCHLARSDAVKFNGESRGTFRERFTSLALPHDCAECWCAPLVELSLLFSLKPQAIWNALRVLR